jgi:hypothetical protein
MAASLLGAFANPLDNAADTAQRVAAAAQAGSFTMPPMIGSILSAVSVQQDPATATQNAAASPSPTANRAPAEMPAEAPPAWRAWLSGWRLVAVLAAAAVAGWYLLGRRRRG